MQNNRKFMYKKIEIHDMGLHPTRHVGKGSPNLMHVIPIYELWKLICMHGKCVENLQLKIYYCNLRGQAFTTGSIDYNG